MPNPFHPLRLNVGFIIHQSAGFSRSFPFNSQNLVLEPELNLQGFHGEIVITRTSQGLLIQADLQAAISTNCVRCLTPFPLALQVNFSELFGSAKLPGIEPELILPEDGYINLSPMVREYFLLEIPINPTCKKDCKGICPICGGNRNTADCDHPEVTIDPRLAKLKSLLDD